MNNISLLTYTHSKCTDLHLPYFDRIKKYFPELLHNYVTSNEYVNFGTYIPYKDNDTHSNQMINAIDSIPTEYLIYSQEDYILFDKVKIKDLYKAINILDVDPKIGFIRLIQSGLGDNRDNEYNEDYNYIDKSSIYYYSTQITLWRKTVMKQMFELSKVKSIFDEPYNSHHLRALNIHGIYDKKRGESVGGHYNSFIYPYIATAKVKGNWNIQEYANQIKDIFMEYNIKANNNG
jgi:hypothetical protein